MGVFSVFKKFLLISLSLFIMFSVFSSSLEAKNTSTKTVNELWEEKDFKAAEVIMKHLDTYTDKNGYKIIRVLKKKTLDKELANLDYPMTSSQLVSYVENFNELINDDKKLSEFTKNVSNELSSLINKDTNSEISVKGAISCSNVLGAIGLIHAGSYTAAALALGITGGLSASIPFIISTAYYLGSTLCK